MKFVLFFILFPDEDSIASTVYYAGPEDHAVSDLVSLLRFVSKVYRGCKPGDLEDFMLKRPGVPCHLLVPLAGAKYAPARSLLLKVASEAGQARANNVAKLYNVLKTYAARLSAARLDPEMSLWVFHYSRGVSRSSGPVVHLRALKVISFAADTGNLDMGNSGSPYELNTLAEAESRMEACHRLGGLIAMHQAAPPSTLGAWCRTASVFAAQYREAFAAGQGSTDYLPSWFARALLSQDGPLAVQEIAYRCLVPLAAQSPSLSTLNPNVHASNLQF